MTNNPHVTDASNRQDGMLCEKMCNRTGDRCAETEIGRRIL